MRKRKSKSRSSSQGDPRRKKKKRKPRFEIPDAFKIVAMDLDRPIKKHPHVVGQEAIGDECPSGYVLLERITIGGHYWCLYVGDGLPLALKC